MKFVLTKRLIRDISAYTNRLLRREGKGSNGFKKGGRGVKEEGDDDEDNGDEG